MNKPKPIGEELIELLLFYYGTFVTLLAVGQLPNEPNWNVVTSLVSISVIVLVIVYFSRSVYGAYRQAHPKEAHHNE